jgi:hypothetical protein
VAIDRQQPLEYEHANPHPNADSYKHARWADRHSDPHANSNEYTRWPNHYPNPDADTHSYTGCTDCYAYTYANEHASCVNEHTDTDSYDRRVRLLARMGFNDTV